MENAILKIFFSDNYNKHIIQAFLSKTKEAILLSTSMPWCLVSSARQTASPLIFPNKIAADFLQFPTLSFATSTNPPTHCLSSTNTFSFNGPYLTFSTNIPTKLQQLQKSSSCSLLFLMRLMIVLKRVAGMSLTVWMEDGIMKSKVMILMAWGVYLLVSGSNWLAILSKVGIHFSSRVLSVCLIRPIVSKALYTIVSLKLP